MNNNEEEFNNKDNNLNVQLDDGQVRKKIYENFWFVLIALIFVAPVGIFLLWKYRKDDNHNAKIVLTILAMILFIYNYIIPGGSNINVSEYFPSEPMNKIYYTYGDEYKEYVFAADEEIIRLGTKENVLTWLNNYYINEDSRFSKLFSSSGVYEIYTDEIISIELSDGFAKDKEIIQLSNARKWSAHDGKDTGSERSSLSKKRYRTSVEAGLFYDCLEVITKSKTSDGIMITRDYYAPNVGKILTELKGDNGEFITFKELIDYEVY